jgi:DNA-binding transcriptional regulator YiaG
MTVAEKKRRPKSVPSDPAGWPEFLRELRRRLNLKQTEAAPRVGVGQGVWSAWEKGIRVPSRQSALLIQLLSDGKI